MTTKRLKRSDATKERPDGGAALISRKPRRAVISFSMQNTAVPTTSKNSSPAERLVYTTDVLANALSGFNPDKAFDGQTVEDPNSIFNRRVVIKRTDSSALTRENELRNLATFLFQIAVVRAARDAIDPLNETLRADNIRTEQNLIFNESERWGIVNQALLESGKAALPRPSIATEQAVRAFLNTKPAIIAISRYKARIKDQAAEKVSGIALAAAGKATALALAGHPNPGELGLKTNRSLARVRG